MPKKVRRSALLFMLRPSKKPCVGPVPRAAPIEAESWLVHLLKTPVHGGVAWVYPKTVAYPSCGSRRVRWLLQLGLLSEDKGELVS